MERFTRLSALLVMTLALCSCQTIPDVHYKVTAGQDARTSRDSAALAYELSQKTWCTNDEAFSLILILVDGEDRYLNFDNRRVALHVKGLADIDWNLRADEPVTKGTMAYMLCRATDTRGGLFMHLVGGRRYAYREAVYQDFIQSGSEYEPLTGPEVVGIIGRVSRH